MRRSFGLRENQQFLSAVNDYQDKHYMITQMGGEYAETLKEYFKDKLDYWEFANFHIVQTTWGNTSGGWQGIGGSAMTTDYTVVIENQLTKAVFVYFSGKLAYICELDEKYDRDHIRGYNETNLLNILYKIKRSR